MVVAILCGATGAGKSDIAMRLAAANGFEIISADSRQIYRGLEIGVNAPTAGDLEKVRHHLVAFLDPERNFSPREFPDRVHSVLADHPAARFLIVGGTGLYLKELLYPAAFDRGPTPEAVRLRVQEKLEREGLEAMHAELSRVDPEGARPLHPHDRYRILKRWENLLITGESYVRFGTRPGMDARFAGVPLLWMDLDRERLYARIDARAEAMIRSGWREEAEKLLTIPGFADSPAFSALGYKEMGEVSGGRLTLEEALRRIQKQTRNYAKRQLTFYRNQFPTARRWDSESLEQALEQCGWNWEAFRERFYAPSEASNPSIGP